MRRHLGTEAQKTQKSDLYVAIKGTLTVGRGKKCQSFSLHTPILILH